jgi:signal transduction histidine kinase
VTGRRRGEGDPLGALAAARDWRGTAIGPPAGWPPALRATLDVCLRSRLPMVVWWGPELAVLYNDACRLLLGADRHPGALGRPGREGVPEAWAALGPVLDRVRTAGVATWTEDGRLLVPRDGTVEERYFTGSHSPIPDGAGAAGGVLTAFHETTRRVVAARRRATLEALGAAVGLSRSADEACARAAECVAANAADLPFALVYVLDGAAGGQARLAAAAGLPAGTALSPVRHGLGPGAGPWPLGRALDAPQPVAVAGLPGPAGELPGGRGDPPPPGALLLPLVSRGANGAAGVLVAGLSPRGALDRAYRAFLGGVAGHVAASIAVAEAVRGARLRTEARAEVDRVKTAVLARERAARQAAEAASRGKDEMLSTLGHELRNPLSVIVNAAAVLERMDGDETTTRMAAIVGRQSRVLGRLIDDLLEVARVTLGRVTLDRECVALDEVARAAVAALELGPAGERVAVSTRPTRVVGDRARLEQVVAALVEHAVRHTSPPGRIVVEVRPEGGQGVLRVADEGEGIPAELLPRVFDLFARTGRGPGAGPGPDLGLAVVQRLVELHGGRVEAASAGPGRGSEFVVRLPGAEAAGPPVAPAAARSARGG